MISFRTKCDLASILANFNDFLLHNVAYSG